MRTAATSLSPTVLTRILILRPLEPERHVYYKYKEKKVLIRAWEVHGGPDGLWNL